MIEKKKQYERITYGGQLQAEINDIDRKVQEILAQPFSAIFKDELEDLNRRKYLNLRAISRGEYRERWLESLEECDRRIEAMFPDIDFS